MRTKVWRSARPRESRGGPSTCGSERTTLGELPRKSVGRPVDTSADRRRGPRHVANERARSCGLRRSRFEFGSGGRAAADVKDGLTPSSISAAHARSRVVRAGPAARGAPTAGSKMWRPHHRRVRRDCRAAARLAATWVQSAAASPRHRDALHDWHARALNESRAGSARRSRSQGAPNARRRARSAIELRSATRSSTADDTKRARRARRRDLSYKRRVDVERASRRPLNASSTVSHDTDG